MLETLKVRNFQSLHNIDLELAPFTVIVGASSSGKSALVRACQLLTANRRGTAFITHGEQTAQVIAQTQNGAISIKRSRLSTGANEYTIVPNEGEPLTWTKLHGETPEEVTKFLNIPPHKLNVASQFDPPYLLSESAPEAARILGALTNVHVIMDASRESNKRKLAINAALKRDKEESAAIKERLPEFVQLKAEAKKLDKVEKILKKLQLFQEKKEALEAALLIVAATKERKLAAKKILKANELPDIKQLQLLHQKTMRLEETVMSMGIMEEQMSSNKTRQQRATEDIVVLQGQHIQLLTEAGTCPTCGQSTKELTHD